MAPQLPPALLITRPEPSASRFLAQVRAALVSPVIAVISPLIGIAPVNADVDLTGYAGVILTSQNAVPALAGRMPTGLQAWCVGDATAAAAARLGLDARSAGGDADALVAAILASGQTGPYLHLRGDPSRGDVAARLTAAGTPTDAVVVYRQTAPALSAAAHALLRGPSPVVLPVFSPESAVNLLAMAPFQAPLHLIAISPATARVLSGLSHADLTIAPHPDAQAMWRATVDLLAVDPPKG